MIDHWPSPGRGRPAQLRRQPGLRLPAQAGGATRPGRAQTPARPPNQSRGQPGARTPTDAVRALLAGRIAQVHARLAPQRREKVTVQQLERAWHRTMPHAAPQADIAIVHHEIAASGAVVAHIAVTTPDDSRRAADRDPAHAANSAASPRCN